MTTTRVDILAMLDRLGANYPAWKVTPTLIELWQQEFAQVDPRTFAVACSQYMRAHPDFGPSVGHIHELVQGGPKSTELNPSDAWAEVMRWIQIGRYTTTRPNQPPRWSHPAIERALGIFGGWERLSEQLSSDVPSNRARFIEAVTSYGRAAQREQQYLGAEELVTALLANRSGMKQLYGADYVDPPEYDDRVLTNGVARESEEA